LFRALAPDDGRRLGEYFLGLSDATRAVYAPHPFDRVTADAICADLRPGELLRLVATVGPAGDERLVGYMMLHFFSREGEEKRYAACGLQLERSSDCTFAPCVADEYQGRGLGPLMATYLFEFLHRMGRRYVALQGGVQARNTRAVRFYAKLGFRKIGEFETQLLNYDMVLDLRQTPWRRAAAQAATV
jgi:GNAT superfamily N-acetyltransferase